MGRPRGFDADDVARTAVHLVTDRGYDAVGIDDIVRATGVARGSLYNVFGSKAGIVAHGMTIVTACGTVEQTARLTAMLLASTGARDPLIADQLRIQLRELAARGSVQMQVGAALLERHADLLSPTRTTKGE
jgi:AcrR family transcriptional regulator